MTLFWGISARVLLAHKAEHWEKLALNVGRYPTGQGIM